MFKVLEEYDGIALPKVETERLVLRQRTLDDVEDIFAYAKLAEVSYPAGFPPVKSLEDEITYLQDIYPANPEKEGPPSGYGITLKGNEKVIGSVDFNNRHADDVLEIGYLLHPDYWGRGIVPEAAAALVEIGFTLLGLHKIELGCYDYNKKIQAVARKLGFTLEATLRDRKDAQGRRCNDLRFGLLRSEWEINQKQVSIFLIGAPASGKMTIGHALEAKLKAELFHNHDAIDYALRFLGDFSPEMMDAQRDITIAMMRGFAKQQRKMLGTAVIDFSQV